MANEKRGIVKQQKYKIIFFLLSERFKGACLTVFRKFSTRTAIKLSVSMCGNFFGLNISSIWPRGATHNAKLSMSGSALYCGHRVPQGLTGCSRAGYLSTAATPSIRCNSLTLAIQYKLFTERLRQLTGIGFSWPRASKIGYRRPLGRYSCRDIVHGDFVSLWPYSATTETFRPPHNTLFPRRL